MPALSATLAEVADPVLELDELWSCVLKKARKRSHLDCAAVARRAKLSPLLSETAARRTCRRLWQAIPDKYRQAHCSTDFWEASTKVLPEAQHTAVGKESGETAHIERWNLTLRQRLARFVRRTLSFSKSSVMHEACLRLFIHRYNCHHALTLL